MQDRTTGHPPEIQEFIDWQEHPYDDGYYVGGRLPPRGVLRADLIMYAILLVLGLVIAALS